jgi:hypothetical protein
MTTYRNDTKTGLETQSNSIWYNLFWEVGGVSRVQSTDFDVVVLCVGADRTADVSTRRLGSECFLPWHVWIDSRTSVKCVKDARCIEGSCDQNRTWNTVELDMIQFVLRSWRSESCTEYWLWCVSLCVGADCTVVEEWVVYLVLTLIWCFVCWCGPYGWRLKSTFREWVLPLPWHVWIDSRTSVKCVKDTLCIEGSYEHLVRLQRLDIQGSLVRVHSFVIQPWTFLCLCDWTDDHIQKRHQNRTWNTVELDTMMIQFVLRSWRSESCTEYWLWCVVLCVGTEPYGWRLDSTFRSWVFSPLTCVNRFQDECEVCEGCSVYRGICEHLVRLQTWYTGLSG